MSILKNGVGVALVAGVLAAACAGTPASPEVRTTQVSRGAVTETVAVSGSVSSSVTVRLNPVTAGTVKQLFVSAGQLVTAGQPLAQLDTTDLQSALTTAQNNAAAAQANYDRALVGATDAQNSLATTQQSTANDVATAQQTLAKVKSNYAAAKANFSLKLYFSIMNDLLTYATQISAAQDQVSRVQSDLSAGIQSTDDRAAQTSMNQAAAALSNAQSFVQSVLTPAQGDFKVAVDQVLAAEDLFDLAVAANGDTSTASQQMQGAQVTYNTASTRLSSAIDAVNAPVGSAITSTTAAQNSLNTLYARTDTTLDPARADIATLLVNLTNEQQAATNMKSKVSQVGAALNTIVDTITNSYVTTVQNVAAAQIRATQSVQSAQSSVNSQPASVQSALNNLLNAQTNLATTQTNLDKATIKATISGVIVSISAQPGENVSSGGSTGFIVLANTDTIALHGTIGEADIVKLKLGQVATVTVDALGTTKMTGKVTALDPVATIAQGVPVYGVDVTIDLPSSTVRPGMSGTAQVIIASSPNTLVVPNLAVKAQTGRRYLTLMKDGQPVDTDIRFGISNDTVTEVLSGAQEGDVVVLPQPRAAASGAKGFQFGGGGQRPPGR